LEAKTKVVLKENESPDFSLPLSSPLPLSSLSSPKVRLGLEL
jgi:hypothetical protein